MSGEELLRGVVWEELPRPEEGDDTLPYATHRGVLEWAGARLRCYILDDGRRIVDADDIAEFLRERAE